MGGDVESSWGAQVRRVPVGVLALAALLVFVGAGFVLGGVYLALAGRTGWVSALVGVAVGPVVLWVALHLVRLVPWTWHALILLLVLLLASSAFRLLAEPTSLLAPLLEIGAETGFLLYLLRPRVRRSFGRR